MELPEVRSIANKLEDIRKNPSDDRITRLTDIGLQLARLQYRVQSQICIGFVDVPN